MNFTHIEALYQIARTVAHINGNQECPLKYKLLKPVTFQGSPKLHGTNAGVACTPDALIGQSRSRAISVEDDHLGFAKFLAEEATTKAIRIIESRIRHATGLTDTEPLTLFGEWCGPGIQKGCGIHQVPRRQFVLFAVVAGDVDSHRYLDAVPSLGNEFEEASIYSIVDGPSWELTIDFTDRDSVQAAADAAGKLVEEVEAQCPWAARFGATGIGEGIVWIPIGDQWGRTELYFKTKGEKHKNPSAKEKVKIQVDPAVLANVLEFVGHALTEARLDQGFDALREQGLSLEMKSLGTYLKWVGQDVKRECEAELEANGIDWKAASKEVTTRARNHFMKAVQAAL